MRGLDPRIQRFVASETKRWNAGSSPAMTSNGRSMTAAAAGS